MNNLSFLHAEIEKDNSAIYTLSDREQEVLTLIANGMSNKEIGRTLDICEGTVKVHVKNIMRKLKCGSRLEAAILAIRMDRNIQPVWGQKS